MNEQKNTAENTVNKQKDLETAGKTREKEDPKQLLLTASETDNYEDKISINTPHTGVLNPHCADYDPDLNKWLVYYTVRHTPMLSLIPDALLEQLAHYPETTVAE